MSKDDKGTVDFSKSTFHKKAIALPVLILEKEFKTGDWLVWDTVTHTEHYRGTRDGAIQALAGNAPVVKVEPIDEIVPAVTPIVEGPQIEEVKTDVPQLNLF